MVSEYERGRVLTGPRMPVLCYYSDSVLREHHVEGIIWSISVFELSSKAFFNCSAGVLRVWFGSAVKMLLGSVAVRASGTSHPHGLRTH